MQLGSCFEDLVVRNTVVQTDRELDVWFKRYTHLKIFIANKKNMSNYVS